MTRALGASRLYVRHLYVGMTRAKERLVLTYVSERGGKPTGGHRVLEEVGLIPRMVTC